MPKTPWVFLVAVAAIAACSSNDLALNPCPVSANALICGGLNVGGSSERISAVLLANPYSRPVISLPDTVHVGVSFTVTFYTLFRGCVAPDGETLRTGTGVTAIIPMEIVQRVPGEACPQFVFIGPRSARITLSDVGTDTVRVVGRTENAESSALDSVSANIVVLP
jgi:hypothetical protein